MTTLTAPVPQTPASEISVYYDAASGEEKHVVHAKNSADTITKSHSPTLDHDAPVSSGNADVTRKPSVATGALEPREPASGGILSKSAEKQPETTNSAGTSNVRDSGFSDSKDKSVAFVAPTTSHVKSEATTHDQPSPAYEPTPGASSALTDIKAPPRASTLLEKEKSGTIDEDKPLSGDAANVQRTSTGAFAKGAAVTGPDAKPAEVAGQHERAATAESQLTPKVKAKITKTELKEAKKMIKMIKSEGAAQEKSIKSTLSELAKLQKVQRQAASDESKALSAHGKATKYAHKLHTKFLAAKAKDEKASADEKAKGEQLEASRSYAAQMTDKLAHETKAYEELNKQFMVDKREREVKLAELLAMKNQK